ncbi:hypothetical protein D4R47_03180 [archaeon]|nr:MAG: hypothetical protein D4R47_03180 [archaeon]
MPVLRSEQGYCATKARHIVVAFQQCRLSFGKAREMAGMTLWTFQQMLANLLLDDLDRELER